MYIFFSLFLVEESCIVRGGIAVCFVTAVSRVTHRNNNFVVQLTFLYCESIVEALKKEGAIM